MAREKAGVVSLMCAVATNRKQFFELVQSIEREASCHIDEMTLQGELDARYPGRTSVDKEETCLLLMACTVPPKRKSRC